MTIRRLYVHAVAANGPFNTPIPLKGTDIDVQPSALPRHPAESSPANKRPRYPRAASGFFKTIAQDNPRSAQGVKAGLAALIAVEKKT